MNHAETGLPCPKCPSSDAFATFEDGKGGYCYSCQQYSKFDVKGEMPLQTVPKTKPAKLDPTGEAVGIPERYLNEETCRKYSYLVNPAGEHLATYHTPAGQPVAQKVRSADKNFRWVGDSRKAGLFGQHLWRPGGKRLVITEGEIDCLSVAQVMGLRWPVVSVPDGAGSAKAAVARQLEWVDTFEVVVIMFDMDAVGRKAAQEVAELLTPGRAHIANLPRKDPNDMLAAGETRQLLDAVWQAALYRPDGIVEGADLWEQVSRELPRGLSYPWRALDVMTYGIRRREIVCWTGGTGIGKTQVTKEVFHRLALVHEEPVGIISLEESVRHAALCQMSLFANRRLHLPTVRAGVSSEEMKLYFAGTMGTRRFYFYDHFGSVDAGSLIPKIRYMVKALGVRYVMLDHVSIMVSGSATEGDERKRIDSLMTGLRTTAENLGIGLHIISHLRKAAGKPHEEGGQVSLQDLRGSGAIAQLSDIVIACERNQQADCPTERNVTRLRVVKNRFSGDTGLAGEITFDSKTGRLVEAAVPYTPGELD